MFLPTLTIIVVNVCSKPDRIVTHHQIIDEKIMEKENFLQNLDLFI